MDIVSTADSDDGEEKAIFGIFIKNVVPDSPAGNCGELHVSYSCVCLIYSMLLDVHISVLFFHTLQLL